MNSTCTVLIAPNGWGKSRFLERFSQGHIPSFFSRDRHPDGRMFALVNQTLDYPVIASRVASVLETPLVIGGMTLPAARERVRSLLAEVGFEYLLNSRMEHLSGGEDRIVHLLSSMIQAPSHLIVDDPFGMLDTRRQSSVKKLLLQYICSEQESTKCSTHLVVAMSDAKSQSVADLATGIDMLTYRGEPRARFEGFDYFLTQLSRCGRGNAADIRAAEVTLRVGARELVHRRSFNFKAGQVHLLVGPNAAGKSLLLKAIACRLPRQVSLAHGFLVVEDREHKGHCRFWHPRSVILVPQDSTRLLVGLDPWLAVCQLCSTSDAELIKAAQLLLGLGLVWNNRPVTDASVGESRFVTVMLAVIAAVLRPEVQWLLLDEPDAYLDEAHRCMLNLLTNLVASLGKGVLVVSHHPELYQNRVEVSINP